MLKHMLLLTSVFSVAACSPSNEVTFKPSTGDQHSYWTYSDVQVSSAGNKQHQVSSIRQYFKITDTSPLKIVATADYVDIKAGSHRLSSLATDSQDNIVMQLLSEGFELTVDPDSGQLQNFRALDDELWQEILKNKGKDAITELSKSTFTPGVLKTIPAKVGAKVDLPELAGRSVSVTVNAVTKDSVTAIIEGHNEQGDINAYGVMQLNRDNGWLKQLLLITDEQLERYGQTLNVRGRFAMLPGDQPTQLQFGDWKYLNDWSPIPTIDQREDAQLEPPTGKSLFPNDQGTYQSGKNGIKLEIPFHTPPNQVTGNIKLTDIKGVDAQQTSLDLNLQWIAKSSFEGFTSISSEVVPIGWNKEAELDRIDSLTATLDFYPSHIIAKKVGWQPGVQHIDINGAKITIKPIEDQANTYEVTLHSTKDTEILFVTTGLTGQFRALPNQENEFLHYDEKLAFNQYLHNPMPETSLYRLEQQPTEVTFYARQTAKQSTYSREITFVSPEAYNKRPDNPPLSDGLYYEYQFADVTPQKELNFDDLQPNTEMKQSSAITLPANWDRLCQLNVISGNDTNGHKIVWFADDLYTDISSPTTYKLSTDDGVRSYFYGITVTSELRCNGQPKWQTLDYQPSDKPWLLSLADIDGIDSKQSVKDFMANYNLLNAFGQKLDVIRADGDSPNLENNPSLSDILTAQGELRVTGRVARIEHLSPVGEPMTKQWTTTFPELP